MVRRLALALLFAVGLAGDAAAQVGWPAFQPYLAPDYSASPGAAALPADLRSEPPHADLAPARRAFAGRWIGWAGRARAIDLAFAVETFTAEGATIAFAMADASGPVADYRGFARFVGNELHAQLDDGRSARFRLRADGHLDVLAVGANEASDPPERVRWTAGLLWRGISGSRETMMLPSGIVEDGREVRLETKIFRPDGAGPFPLPVFHHGSTGRGLDPAAFRAPIDVATIAMAFVEQGWMVAFPARRGRGGSDGLYDEGFSADRKQGYSCEPAIAIAGFEHALIDAKAATDAVRRRPDVDQSRVLVGGQSRGGILAAAYAGTWPSEVRGVINFVGGWLGESCGGGINRALFARGAGFPGETLWLYGERDSFYSIAHTRRSVDAFNAAGGRARFSVFDLGESSNGHYLIGRPELWRPTIADYLKRIGLE